MKKLAGVFLVVLVLLASVFECRSQNMFRKITDFDGDGKADFAITRNIGGTKYWYIWQTTAGFRVDQYGHDTDEAVAGDYDGDGKTDVAIFRKTVPPGQPTLMSYAYWIAGSAAGSMVRGWAYNTYNASVSYHQDYNADGQTDGAWTIDNNTSYFLHYSSGGTIGVSNPGGTFIKVGDMTGDNKADTAAYDSSNLVRIRNSTTGAIQSVHFGLPGDRYVAADFDGDSRGDLTVFRPSDGTWWWIRSSDGVTNVARWGQNGDIPVPADYDNDGKTDLAIYRPGSQSHYWINGSQNGLIVVAWGTTGDTPVGY